MCLHIMYIQIQYSIKGRLGNKYSTIHQSKNREKRKKAPKQNENSRVNYAVVKPK